MGGDRKLVDDVRRTDQCLYCEKQSGELEARDHARLVHDLNDPYVDQQWHHATRASEFSGAGDAQLPDVDVGHVGVGSWVCGFAVDRFSGTLVEAGHLSGCRRRTVSLRDLRLACVARRGWGDRVVGDGDSFLCGVRENVQSRSGGDRIDLLAFRRSLVDLSIRLLLGDRKRAIKF